MEMALTAGGGERAGAVRHVQLQDVLQYVRDQIVVSKRDPYAAFGNRVVELNTQGHPFFRPDTLEEIDTLSVHDACTFYRKCFCDPSEFTFVVVGNLDLAATRALLGKYLGGLPTGQGLLPVVRWTPACLPCRHWER